MRLSERPPIPSVVEGLKSPSAAGQSQSAHSWGSESALLNPHQTTLSMYRRIFGSTR